MRHGCIGRAGHDFLTFRRSDCVSVTFDGSSRDVWFDPAYPTVGRSEYKHLTFDWSDHVFLPLDRSDHDLLSLGGCSSFRRSEHDCLPSVTTKSYENSNWACLQLLPESFQVQPIFICAATSEPSSRLDSWLKRSEHQCFNEILFVNSYAQVAYSHHSCVPWPDIQCHFVFGDNLDKRCCPSLSQTRRTRNLTHYVEKMSSTVLRRLS